MSETERILDLWRTSTRRGDACLLATVVGVEGSSYRKPGARMLLTQSGLRAGTISGGCLEGEVAKKAWWLTENGASVQRYASFYDEDSGDAYGLGCGGTVHVLVERAPAAHTILEALETNRRERTAFSAVYVVDAGARADLLGTALVLDASGQVRFTRESVEPAFRPLAEEALATRQAAWHTVRIAGADCRVFTEYIAPPIDLLILGAGDDARPLASYGHSLDWKVTVADGRSHMARAERFPEAERVRVIDPADPLNALPVSARTAAVLMTHSYQQDCELLRALLPRDLAYIGVLGPKRRTAHLVRRIAAELGMTEAECLARVHSPVGLDLGAETPAAVALSIAAEIHAVLHAREPIPLRRKTAGVTAPSQPPTLIELPGA